MSLLDQRAAYLHEVLVCGGIRAAADQLGVNPSVVSRQIRRLEAEAGMALLERHGRQVKVTEAGELVVEQFRAQQRLSSELRDTLARLNNLEAGKVVVSVGDGFIDTFVEQVLKKVSVRHPDVMIEVKTGIYYPREPHHMVIDDEVDIAITYGPVSDPRLTIRSFVRGPLCALVAPDHPLADYEQVSVADLTCHKLIFLPEASGSQRCINAVFADAGNLVTPAYRCNLHSVARRMAAAGIGVAFMTPKAAHDEIGRGLIRAIPIDHPVAASTVGNLVRRTGRRLSPAAHFLWQLMLQMQ